jgi:O-antigen/teichoic acid export membrane protein
MQSVDVILLGKFTDFETVAYYSAAIKLTTIISLVLTSVNAVFAPKIAELYSNKDFLNLNLNLKKATRLIFILTIPGIVLLAVFSTVFLSFFGEGYMQAKNALIILLLGQTVNALCGSVGVYMNMTGKQNTLQIILIISFLLNLVLNWLLIPLYGMIGAAIATSISMVLWNITGTIYLLKTDKIKTFLN